MKKTQPMCKFCNKENEQFICEIEPTPDKTVDPLNYCRRFVCPYFKEDNARNITAQTVYTIENIKGGKYDN